MSVTVVCKVRNNPVPPAILELDCPVLILDYSFTDKNTGILVDDYGFVSRDGNLVKGNTVYSKHDPVQYDTFFDVLTRISASVAVIVDDDVVGLSPDWFQKITHPFLDEGVKFTYCDFSNNGVPIFHTTLPSKIIKMPLCAVRTKIIQKTPPDLLQHICGNVMSRYIPELLVEIDD